MLARQGAQGGLGGLSGLGREVAGTEQGAALHRWAVVSGSRPTRICVGGGGDEVAHLVGDAGAMAARVEHNATRSVRIDSTIPSPCPWAPPRRRR